jgi:radical SAM protein with 4Fe4S-binding SPASM domain
MDLVAVLTNGYFLQEEAVERLLKYKDKLMFNISMDSYRPEFHDKFRGKEGAHARTAKAMELLGRHGFTYRAAMSVTDGNFFDIEGTIKLAKRHGAKIFGMTPVLDTGRGDELCAGQKQKTDMDFARKCMEYEKYILGNYRDFIHLVTEAQALDVRKSNCGLIHRSVTVGPDGELRPCVMFGGGVIKIGNIYQQSFKEIFEGKLGVFFNRLHGPKPEVCGDCKHLPYCQNCPLKGVKMALKTPDCRWAAQTGVLKYVKDAPSHKVCGNAQEPYYG